MTDKTVKLRLTLDTDTLPPAAKVAKEAVDAIGDAGKAAGTKIDAGLGAATDTIKRTGEAGTDAGNKISSALEAAQNKSQDFNSAMLSNEAAMGGSRTSALDLGNAVDRLVESEANASARIRDVVSSSLAQQAAWASGQAAANREAEARRDAAAATEQESQARLGARASYDALGASASAFLQEQNALRSAMEQEATSLDDIAEKRAWYADAVSRSMLTIEEHTAASAALDRQEKAIQQSMAKSATEVQNLVGKYAPAHAALVQIEADERKLNAARDAGTITQENYQRASAGLNTSRARWMAEAKGIDDVGASLGKLNLTSKEALSQYLQVGRSIAAGDWEGASRNMMQAANSAGVLRGGLSALGGVGGLVLGTVLAVVAAVGALGIAFTQGYLEDQQYNQGLIATGGYAGKTAAELRELASAVGDTTGEYADAREAINGLVNTGKIVGDQLGIAAQAAVDLASVTGKSIDQATTSIARLADDPVKAVRALDEQLHLLTATQYAQIRSLEEQGDKQAAATLAMNIAADALARRRVDIVENLGLIERWVNQTAFAWGTLWEKMKGVGKADSFDQLNASLLQLEERKKALLDGGSRTSGFDWLNDLTDAGYRDELGQLVQKIGQVRAARDALSSPVIAAQQQASDQQWEEGIKSTTDALAKLGSALSDDEVARQVRRATQGMDTYEAHLFDEAVREGIKTQLESAQLDRSLIDGKRNLTVLEGERRKDVKASTAAVNEYNTAQSAWSDLIDRISGKTGPAAKAQSDYEIGMRALEDRAYALAIAGGDVVKILEEWQQGEADLTLKLHETNAAIDKQSDVIGNVLQQLRDETATAGMTDRQRYQYDAVMKAKDAWAALSDEQRAAKPLTEAMTASLADQAGAIFDNAKQAEDWTRAWEQAGSDVADALADVIVDGMDDWDDFGDALIDITKRTVSQMLAEFLRLQVINPILNSLLGTGLQTGGGGFNLGSLASLFGGGGSAPALGSSANAGGGMSMANLASMGSSLWSGFSSAASAFGQTGGLFSAANWAQAGSSMMGGFTSAFPGIASMFGLGGGAAAFTGAGSLAYGSGTAAAGFGGTFGGGTAAYGAGSGAAAAGGGASGAMTAMLSNPVTWILAGAAASAKYYGEGWRNAENTNNDTLGGKLGGLTMAADSLLQGLGLSAKWAAILSGSSLHTRIWGRKDPVVQSSALDFGFDGDGASGSMVAQIKEKGGWFRSDKRYEKSAALDDETQAAIDEMFATFQAAMTNSAAMLGIEAPALIASAIKQNFDKSGKLTSTIVTVLGRQWTESMEDAVVRIGAEQVIAAVGVSASNASAIAEQWRGSAAMLAEGAQFLLLAQADINANGGLLRADPTARVDGGGLAEVTELIQRLNVSGETLAQTYARVATAAALLDAAVMLTGTAYDKTRAEFVEFAADMATAAGGVDQLSAYWQNYYNRFYTMTERAQVAFDQATDAADAAFGKIGLNLADFAGADGAAAFRALFEERMPTLSAEATVQWLQAAAAMGIMIDASAALAQSTGNAAIAIAQSADQLATVQGILDGNAWNLAAAGMNAAQLAIRDINQGYEEQRRQLVENLATEKQLALLEEQRLAALQAQYDGFAAQFRPPSDPDSLAGQRETIRAWEADQIAQLQAYAIAAGMEAAAAGDLANVHDEAARRLVAAQAVFEGAYQDYMAQFRPDAALPDGSQATSLAQAREQLAALELDQIARANALAIAAGHAGAAELDLIAIHEHNAAALGVIQARLMADYDRYMDPFRTGAALPGIDDATNMADVWERGSVVVQAQIDTANALAIAAGLSGASAEDIELIWERLHESIAAAQARLDADYDRYMAQFRPGAALPDGSQATSLAQAREQLDAVEQQQIATANALAIAAGRTGAAELDLLAIHEHNAAALGVIQARLMANYDRFMDQFRSGSELPDIGAASNMGEAWERGSVVVQAQIDTANALAIAAGLSGASAEDIELIWARVHESIAATQVRLLADYDRFMDQFRSVATIGDGADATSVEQARNQNAAWVNEQIRLGNELAIAAGMAGIAQEDLINILAVGAQTVADVQARLEKSYQDIVSGWRESQDETQTVVQWFAEQAALAREAAIAAGRTGIAADDLAALYANATQRLIDSSAALARSLYGTSIDRRIAELQAALTAPGADGLVNYDGLNFELMRLQREQEAQNESQQRINDARTLAGNLAQLMAFQDLSLEDFAKQFDFPLTSLAGDLGMSVDAMTQWIEKQAEEARGLTTINRSITDIGNTTNRLLQRIADTSRIAPTDTDRVQPATGGTDETSRQRLLTLQPVITPVLLSTDSRDSDRTATAVEKIDPLVTQLIEQVRLLVDLVPMTKEANAQRGKTVELLTTIERRSSYDAMKPRGKQHAW